MLQTTQTERKANMNAKTDWNTQLKTDTVAFSALIGTGVLLAWFAAAAPMSDANAVHQAAPAMTHAVVQPADQGNDSRAVVTASRLTKIKGVATRTA
jgi:hypothetical protein